jgi:molybdopterin molybdotransferase
LTRSACRRPAPGQRADFLRGRLGRDADGALVATAFARQDSAMMKLLAEADALILRAPHAPALAAGAMVEVIRLDTLGLAAGI